MLILQVKKICFFSSRVTVCPLEGTFGLSDIDSISFLSTSSSSSGLSFSTCVDMIETVGTTKLRFYPIYEQGMRHGFFFVYHIYDKFSLPFCSSLIYVIRWIFSSCYRSMYRRCIAAKIERYIEIN